MIVLSFFSISASNQGIENFKHLLLGNIVAENEARFYSKVTVSENQGRKDANPCTRKVYSWILYGYNGNSMVYLKPLYSRLDRLAKRQGRQLSTEAKQEHVKILFFKILYGFFLSKKFRIEKY